MPTYDYRCNECGHTFERFQRMSDGMLRKCPECGKLKLKRLMGTGAGIIFRGSGFYETDYKRKSSNGTAGTASSRSSETKTEKKTEQKVESKASGDSKKKKD